MTASHTHRNNNEAELPFGGDISKTIIISPQTDAALDETQKAIKAVFHKDSLSKTNNYIEESIFGNRMTDDHILYANIRRVAIRDIARFEKGAYEEKIEKALKKIKKSLREYYDHSGHPDQFITALKKLPYEVTKDAHIKKMFGSLFRNIPSLVAFYNAQKQMQMATKAKQATFPGWEGITKDAQHPYVKVLSSAEQDDLDIDDYMLSATNIQPGHLDDAKKWMHKKHDDTSRK